MKKICKIESCNNFSSTKGMCMTHYNRMKRYGDPLRENIRTHTLPKEQRIKSYNCMMTRCYNVNDDNYHHYGGRGIKVCERWSLPNGEGHKNFVMDMGKKPEGYSLDRINVNENYSPENCRWATIHEQNTNRRNNNKNVGVSFHKSSNQWRAKLKVKGVIYEKGFKFLNDAIDYRKELEKKYLKLIFQ